MGCQHSVATAAAAVDADAAVTATTPTDNSYRPQQNQHTIGNGNATEIEPLVDHAHKNDDHKSHISISISSRKNNSKKSTSKNLHSNHHHKDDFTKDYVILKQIMGGTMNGALSNIYMVMKRPTVNNIVEPQQQQINQLNVEQQPQLKQEEELITKMQIGPATTTTTTTKSGPTNENKTDDTNIYVLQVIDMHSVAPERRKSMRQEIHYLQTIIHPNILRVHAVYDATRRDNTIATISEICTGSHLDSSIPYPEVRAKKIIAQILDALQYMHQRGLFHNSLNTENILFQDDSQDAMIKIMYAGVSNIQSTPPTRSSYSVVSEQNPQGKDIYAVGMIAYKLLSGGKEPPTDMDTQRIVPGTNLFPGRRWKLISISKNAKNFIEKCLHTWDVQQSGASTYFTIEDAMKHIWMTQESTHRTDNNNNSNSVVVAQQLQHQPPPPVAATSGIAVEKQSTDIVDNATSATLEIPATDASNPLSVSDDNYKGTHGNDENDLHDVPVFLPLDEAVQPNDGTMDEISETNNEIELQTAEQSRHDEYDTIVLADASKETNTNEMVLNLPPSAISDYTMDKDNDVLDSGVIDQQNDKIDNHDDPSLSGSRQIIQPLHETESEIDESRELIQPLHEPDSEMNDGYEALIGTSTIEENPEHLKTPLDTSDDTQATDEFIELSDSFEELTNTGNGKSDVVTINTFKERLRSKYTEEEVNSWFTGTEKYEDATVIDYKAVIKKVIQNRRTIEVQRVDMAFKKIDKGRQGYVTVGNLRAVLGKDALDNKNIEQIIKSADTNRDGKISYQNFEQVVQTYLSMNK